MVDEIFPDIYRIRVPLPQNPLRAVNSYVITGPDRWLMIDTGMNRPECVEVVQAALRELAGNSDRTDLFITHCHSDHVGLVTVLRTGPSKVFINPSDAALILDPQLWANLAAAARAHGFPDPETAVYTHPGRRYLFDGQPEFAGLREGDALAVGRYVFRCVETPGHTPGHMCLYEPRAKLFFSGDHILDNITPNLSGWGPEPDPLGDFLASLDRVAACDIGLVLPGHRDPIRDHRRRIEELKAHHRARIQEVTGILRDHEQTGYQVASQMTWDISYARWEEFPVPQQWFATGEAVAHLLHLECAGKIVRRWRDGVAYFSA